QQWPFKTAHAVASQLIKGRQEHPERSLVELLAEASRSVGKGPLAYSEDALARILSPRYFVTVRTTLGGPAPEETARAAETSRLELDADVDWWHAATDALAAAERRLSERSAAL